MDITPLSLDSRRIPDCQSYVYDFHGDALGYSIIILIPLPVHIGVRLDLQSRRQPIELR